MTEISFIHIHSVSCVLAGIGFIGLLSRRSMGGVAVSLFFIVNAAMIYFIGSDALDTSVHRSGQIWVLNIIIVVLFNIAVLRILLAQAGSSLTDEYSTDHDKNDG
ncbi:MAG: hypothetical protein GF384_04530 [Elusimicrobia bacterium]|nr:hypothetical protein [Elusimicrobiota bacterium]MBD3412110.1 hypothetical protein [Elusimicrobiota bacterium]